MPAPLAFEPPARFDEYEIVRPLGQGAMGAVFLAHDTLLDRRVAIKFIKRYRDVVARERFVIEARAAARLDHPNVVRVYRVGELDDRPFIVSEFVSGRSLDSLARPQPWRTVLGIARDLASGLAAAHRGGVLHRDIKPANAVRLEDGRVVLLDFGLAKLEGEAPRPAALAALSDPIPADQLEGDETLDGDWDAEDEPITSLTGPSASLTREGTVLGTPRYMAPEVRRGQEATAAADVYSLGAVVFELASGQVHRPDESGDSLLALVPDINPGFSQVIARCLATEPAARFGSADGVSLALESIERGRVDGSDESRLSDNPFRGLQSFELEHAAVFYGRDNVSRELLDRLAHTSFVAVAGESGVGKSSLCRAGVMSPIVNGAFADGRSWSTIDIACGRDPAARFLAALDVLDGDLDQPEEIALSVRRRLGAERGLVVYVDQLEELVTISSERSARHASALLAALSAPSPGLKVLASVRGDYLARVGGVGALAGLLSRGLFLLQPMQQGELRQCIVGPAAASGVYFADESMIDDLVDTVGDSPVALPLLQFTLRRLWDRRDRSTQEIRREHLDELGGVGGALAQHADAIYLAMSEDERRAAKNILTALVTSERTRARLGRTELAGAPRVRDAALAHLLDGRLVAQRDGDGEPQFELAHESLVVSWERLRRWLDGKEITRIAADRVRAAAKRWRARGRRREELLRGEQLREAMTATPDELGEDGRALLASSRRAIHRWRLLLVASALAVASLIVGAWMLSRASNRRTLERQVSAKTALADVAEGSARAQRDVVFELRRAALAAFDAGADNADELWNETLSRSAELRRAFASVTPHLESAISLAPERHQLRDRLAAHLFERAQVAEALGDVDATEELLARLGVYDASGQFTARWTEAATIALELVPADAAATIARFGAGPGRELDAEVALEPRMLAAPGSYLIRAAAPGRAPTSLALTVGRGESVERSLRLPPSARVPVGYVYVPPGSFVYGTSEGEAQRSFYEAAPAHRLTTGGFAIAARETTIAEWIEFLESLSPVERAVRLPRAAGQGGRGQIELAREGESWQLRYSPSEIEYVARENEPLVYAERSTRQRQRWWRFPVTAITVADVRAYARWLDETGRVPRARLCREDEWERATKGADDRRFATGDELEASEANFDLTYGRQVGGFGLDEVGSYPSSVSPYGLLDTAGNAFEMTAPRRGDGLVARGGAYYFRSNTAVAANRAVLPPEVRDPTIGFRLCADVSLP